MSRRPLFAAAATMMVWALACGGGSMPSTPTAPTPAPAAPAPPGGGSTTLAGAWTGTGSDPQGAEKMSWMLTQSGDTINGTANLAPMNTADGSCASCHKFKAGTVSGTISGSTITMQLVFPAGGDGVPTPMCTITFAATASATSRDRIDATYTGDDTCEGPIAGGTFTMRSDASLRVR